MAIKVSRFVNVRGLHLIGMSEPETTTIKQETSMLAARVCTCKIVK